MRIIKTLRDLTIRCTFVIAFLFVGLFCSFQDTYADAVDVSTAEELLNYFNSGGEVKLVDDITISNDAFVMADTILDLNGHTLNMSDYTLISYEASFTIEDNSDSETGKVTSTSNYTVQVGSSEKSGSLILNSGTIDCQGTYCIYNNDSVVINGGAVNGNDHVVFNLNSFVMNNGSIHAAEVAVSNYAENSTFVMNGGSIESDDVYYYAVLLSKPNSSFVMNDGSITAIQHNDENDDGAAAIAAFKDTEVTINGGMIIAFSNAITGNGSYSGKSEGTNAKFTINGGSITSINGAGIYAPQVGGVTTVTGGSITGLTGIEIRAGTLNISGGTIVATGDYEVTAAVSGLTTTGAAVSIAQHNTTQPIFVSITGGEFSGEHPISNVNPMDFDQTIIDQISVNVEGGEYAGEDLEDVVDNVPRGYKSVDTSTSTTDTVVVVPTNSAGYYLSATSSGAVDMIGFNGNVATDYSEVNVLTNCRAGYDVVMNASANNNSLYLDGDNTKTPSVSSIEDGRPLISTPNTWGYLATDNTSYVPVGTELFYAVPTASDAPAVLKTASGTASDSDINDKFHVHFGANLGTNLIGGDYSMINDNSGAPGSIIYQVTANPACTNFAIDVSFNKNLDGEGGQTGDSSVYNFPSSSENILHTDEHDVTTLTLSDKIPTRDGYTFVEWNTNPSGSGTSYQPNDVITVGNDAGAGELIGDVTLYAIWENGCPGATICYHGNGADAGTMENQVGAPSTGVALRASNYSRSGYGFAGWNTKSDGSGTNYGPLQNIAIPPSGGIDLYANWIPSAGSLQSWTGADSMQIGDVTALTDDRDGETYAVAKLADGNVWIIENFRLVPSSANITLLNTNHPTASFMSGASASSSSTDLCKDNNSACIDTISYNTNNLNRSLTQSPTNNDNASAWYSYGVLYNWYTATAGNGDFDYTSTSGNNNDGTVSGDICPAGWHLPTGNNGEYAALNDAVSGTANQDVSLRSFANNFVRAGDYNGNAGSGRGVQGRYWTATASENNKAYRFGFDSSSISANGSYNKWDAFAVRCIYDGNRIPTSEVTVNFDEHVSSVNVYNATYGNQQVTTTGSTVTLVDNLPYVISAEFEEGYTVDNWTTTGSGQIVTPSSTSTIYMVSNSATLSLASKAATLTTYTLNYDTTPSADAISSSVATSYNASHTFEISDTIPAVFGSTMIGWSEDPNAATVDYTKDDTITLVNSDPDTISSVSKTLYAVYQTDACPAGNICYYGNGADSGTMSNQIASSNTKTTLIAPNYAKSGYGFAGWIASENAIPYGPNASITTPDLSVSGLRLYAKWIASAGDLQNWNSCSTMTTGAVTALTDTRDSNTYLVTKLADGNCWLGENLRLNPSTAAISSQNTNGPASTFPSEASASQPSNSLCGSDGVDCDNKLQYNLNNLNRSLTQSYDGTGSSVAWYGYGAYYNWYTATAGNGVYDTASGDVTGDICPAGWRLPTGGPSGEYKALNVLINNGATNNNDVWRDYPNNIVYSGEYKTSSRSSSNKQTRLWTATANSKEKSYRMGLDIKNPFVTPENAFNKWDGLVVRCIYKNS